MAAKIEKSFNQNLYAISTDPCWCALCIINNLFNGNRSIFSQVSVFEMLTFAHPNKGTYPQSWAGPASEKNFPYFIFKWMRVDRKFSKFSQYSLESPFSGKIKRIYKQFYTKHFYTPFFRCIHDFRKCSHNSLVKKGFYNFWVFMAYHHLA